MDTIEFGSMIVLLDNIILLCAADFMSTSVLLYITWGDSNRNFDIFMQWYLLSKIGKGTVRP